MSTGDRPLRALHVVEGAAFAGIETHVLALARAWADDPVRMTVIAFAEGPLSAELRERGVETVVCPRRWKFDPAALRTIAERARDVDVIHSHGYLANAYAARAASRIGRPHVITVHGRREPFRGWRHWKMSAYMSIDRRSLRRAARVIAVSRNLAGELAERGVASDRVRVVPNGLPPHSIDTAERDRLRASWGAGPADTIVGFVGRFDPVKAPARFIAIAERFRDEPGVVFVLAGDGPERAICELAAREAGIESRVRFLGFVSAIDNAVAAMDALLMPSNSEGVPQALLAAMRAAVPAVCSRVGGIPEILDGFDDVMAPPDVESLAEALRRLIADPARRIETGRALRERFEERYTARRMAERTAAVYREVCP